MFETKDSGRRAQFASGMVRDTQAGKPRFDLLFPKGVPYSEQMLTRFAELMARGAEKYDERNWEKASGEGELDRARSSALRHMIQWYLGEADEDHAAAVMFNLMAAEYVKYRLDPPCPEHEFRHDDGEGWFCAPVSDGSDAPFTEDSAPAEPAHSWEEPCGEFSETFKVHCMAVRGHTGDHISNDKVTIGGPLLCETLGQHVCSRHPSGFPTAVGALKSA